MPTPDKPAPIPADDKPAELPELPGFPGDEDALPSLEDLEAEDEDDGDMQAELPDLPELQLPDLDDDDLHVDVDDEEGDFEIPDEPGWTDLLQSDNLSSLIAPPVVPWRTMGKIGAEQQPVEIWLDPTKAESTWRNATHDGGSMTLWVGPVELEVMLLPAPAGDEAEVRLGRDAIAGKLWIGWEE